MFTLKIQTIFELYHVFITTILIISKSKGYLRGEDEGAEPFIRAPQGGARIRAWKRGFAPFSRRKKKILFILAWKRCFASFSRLKKVDFLWPRKRVDLDGVKHRPNQSRFCPSWLFFSRPWLKILINFCRIFNYIDWSISF